MFKKIDGKLTIDKDPGAVREYGFDLSDWLQTDSLEALEVTGTGITVDSSEIREDKVVAIVSGGNLGEQASATFRFTTAAGLIDERTIYFNIVQR